MKWNHQSLDKIFESLSGSNPFFKKLKVLLLQNNWEKIVGTPNAMHTQIENFFDGKLFVSADDGVWLNELRMREKEILKRIHEELHGDFVRKIIFIPKKSK
ncbi:MULTISPECIES: DUF721 domain-containing protein [Kosmotoga]|jgi:predicted nucleic acid-binding Zn ribbon protein|uniref:DUF721 domain-containing protein n=1 Tax=Kosmotoga olearia (strain ATCC BAA-1733 / DSM 21960 / TBF 19.5.1) TaxID=521045 RepID=C5CDJ1_KOSOT|nr:MULTISPECIES: DUF721 domain-containing protein [Kosmotoga]ACR79075.1 protein of unknown function DUF721 [Kosmotoga olearia TBF 19.5.1]OAA23777.1 hypothetical protein DU53_01720 [Kosmotoga sp. DU53]